MSNKNKLLMHFLRSPTGKYGLAYNEGDEAYVSEEIAKAMIKDKTAIEATPPSESNSEKSKTSSRK